MFKTITYPRKETLGTPLNRYRVYKDYKNFILIEAENAQAALQASGLKDVQRIIRDNLSLNTIITFGQMSNSSADKPDNENSPAVKETAASDAAPAQQQAAAGADDAPLSNDDVDKLLKG